MDDILEHDIKILWTLYLTSTLFLLYFGLKYAIDKYHKRATYYDFLGFVFWFIQGVFIFARVGIFIYYQL